MILRVLIIKARVNNLYEELFLGWLMSKVKIYFPPLRSFSKSEHDLLSFMAGDCDISAH